MQQPAMMLPVTTPLAARTCPRVALATVLLIAAVAALVRLPGLRTEFWLDEIWSWYIATHARGVRELVSADIARVDNNHLLNTLWLYVLGPARSPVLYRLPAFILGSGSVLVAAHIMQRRGTAAMVIAAALFALSFPQVFYASEARGYALVVFFSLVALDAMELSLGSPQRRWLGWVFGGACILGFLSHLTFLHVYLGLLAASVMCGWHSGLSVAQRLKRLRRLHLAPIAAAIALDVVFVSHMVIGGAAPTQPIWVVIASVSCSLGGPQAGMGAVALTVGAGVVLFVAAGALIWRGDSLGVVALVGGLFSPLLFCGAEQVFSPHPQPLMLRYFMASLSVVLLPIAWSLGELWKRTTAERMVVMIAMWAFVVGSAREQFRFWETGRGHFAMALKRIDEEDASRTIDLSSDNPARMDMLLGFYVRQCFPDRHVILSGEPGRWLLLSGGNNSGASPLAYHGVTYRLLESYPGGEFSGLSWWLYRRAGG